MLKGENKGGVSVSNILNHGATKDTNVARRALRGTLVAFCLRGSNIQTETVPK